MPHIGKKAVRAVTREDAPDARAIIWKKNQGLDAAAGQIRGVLKRLFDHAMTYLSRQAGALFRELQVLAGGRAGDARPRQPEEVFAQNAINSALKVALAGQDVPALTMHDLRRTPPRCCTRTAGRRMWSRRR